MSRPQPFDEREAYLLKQDQRLRQLWGSARAELQRTDLDRRAGLLPPSILRDGELRLRQRVEELETNVERVWAVLLAEYPERALWRQPPPHMRAVGATRGGGS